MERMPYAVKMPDTKSKGGRPKMIPEFIEGKESANRFLSAAKSVLNVSKDRIVELERKHRKTPGTA